MAGINIAYIADVTSFLRGTKSAEDALDDVADALDDVAKDAQKQGKAAGASLERGVEAGADGAVDAVDGLEKSFRNMSKDASKYSKQAGDDLGDNVKKGAREGAQATAEFRDEARSNFSEVASSFTGDMDSAADLVQGTFGGLAGSLTGPLGLALGGVGAIAGVAYAKWKENSEKIEQRVSDMFDDMAQSGQDYVSEDFVNQELQKIFNSAEDAAISYQGLKKAVEDTGISQDLLARAFAGDADAIAAALDGIAAKQATWTDEQKAGNGELAFQDERLSRIASQLGGVATATDSATKRAQEYGDATKKAADDTEASVARAMATYDGLGRKIADLPSEKTVTLRFDATDLDKYLARQRTLLVGVVARPGQPQAV